MNDRRLLNTLGFGVLCGLLLSVSPAVLAGEGPPTSSTEVVCDDGVDNDGDGLADCGDGDCEGVAVCQQDGNPESSDARCSDWVDNDGDGHTDCDDFDCFAEHLSACKGSWQGPLSGPGQTAAAPASAPDELGDALPQLAEGETVEDLIGKYGDADGERNDFLCSDGIDNDGDGRTDCADFGCRFDPTVSVCRGNPGMRFSVVANLAGIYDFIEDTGDVRFTKLQLRTFGPMPGIQDSFFLISARFEKTPRLTFAMFQVPLGGGHFFNVNSGGGGLSGNGPVVSTAKNLLLDPPYYLFSAFDQGNSAALEVFGPVDEVGLVRYRVYVAGGSGLFNGNVGGRYFGFDNDNFTYGGGAALGFNIVGRFSRWDTQFLYNRVPLMVGAAIGAKFDQRAQEQYVAVNTQFNLRYEIFSFAAENYTKRELAFGAWQTATMGRVGLLLWPKHLELGADIGHFTTTAYDKPPEVLETELRRQNDEWQARAALHWYFYRNIGLASLLFTERHITQADDDDEIERQMRVEIQYRF